MRLTNKLLVLFLLPVGFAYGQDSLVNNELQQIRTTLTHYIEGTANGEPDRLRKAFHPDFNLYTVTKQDSLRIISGERYIANIKEGEKSSRQGRILSIDYDGESAVAKAEIVVPGWRVFTDYFILAKYEGSWKIVHKGFSSEPDDINERTVENTTINPIFSEFDRSDHPAVAALVMQDGEVIFKKAFGSTHLDLDEPATVDTKFQLAGLSKHFTAFATLLLEEKGLLRLSDDIRKYLPDLPEYEETITIDHLLSLTSGLPDFWALKYIAGWDQDDMLTQAQALELVRRMKPGFSPGDDYIYSNTDQLLLAEIIARVSRKSFSAFMQTELFQPLRMTNTLVVDDFEAYVPGAAISYEPNGESFKRSALNYGVVGPSNIYSSVNDLAKWERNLTDPKVGSKQLVRKLYSDVKLNNGKVVEDLIGRLTYAQQQFHLERGIPNYYQTGSLGGYASSIFRFFEQDLTVIVLSSGVPYNGYLGIETAYELLENDFIEPGSIDFDNLKTKKLKSKQLEKHVGNYWNEKSGYSRAIMLRDDTLRYVRTWGGRESALVPLTENEFQMVSFGDEKILVTFNDSVKEKTMSLVIGESDPVVSLQKPEYAINESQLEELTGTYYCESLSTVYQLNVENKTLTAKNLKMPKITFRAIEPNVFEADRWQVGSIKFSEDGSSFRIQNDQIRGLSFRKID